MSQVERKGNQPHSVTKFRETTADDRSFDKLKEVGGAAPEAKGKAKASRDAIHGNSFGAKGQPTVGSAGPARKGNQPHTAQASAQYPQRKPVKK